MKKLILDFTEATQDDLEALVNGCNSAFPAFTELQVHFASSHPDHPLPEMFHVFAGLSRHASLCKLSFGFYSYRIQRNVATELVDELHSSLDDVPIIVDEIPYIDSLSEEDRSRNN